MSSGSASMLKTAPRSHINSTMAPPQIPKPRSVMAHQLPPPPPSPKPQAQDDSETNIQVIIRCRRRSECEIQDNSPIIVSSSGLRSNEVTIRARGRSSAYISRRCGAITLRGYAGLQLHTFCLWPNRNRQNIHDARRSHAYPIGQPLTSSRHDPSSSLPPVS